jgi:hypothetical protein
VSSSSPNNADPDNPKFEGWSQRVIEETSTIIYDDVEIRQGQRGLGPTIEPVPCKVFNPTRLYRLLVRSPVDTPETLYFEATVPEHHCLSGLDRAFHRPADQHICGSGCRSTARLIPVGCEDLLDRMMSWWCLVSRSRGLLATTIVVEQDAYVAQTQLEKAGYMSRFLCTDLQFVVADMPVVVCRAKDDNGIEEERYLLL